MSARTPHPLTADAPGSAAAARMIVTNSRSTQDILGRANTRTPHLVRLEVALAKAHYYDSTTLEEEKARHAHLVEVETELRDLDGGCEDARDPGDRWGSEDDGHDVAPAWDRFDR